MSGFVRDAWYVAAWADEVGSIPVRRQIMGETIVMFRDEAGNAFALEDRCIHRGMPLSEGRVMGNVLQCPYHGLEFSGSGACVRIPGQDNIPRGAQVKSFPLHEKDALLWIWPGNRDTADTDLIVDYPFHNDLPGWTWQKGETLTWNCNWELINDNLLDLTHVVLVHETTIGGNMDLHFGAETKVEVQDRAVLSRRYMPNSVPPPAYVESGGFTGNVDRWQEFDAHPGLVVAHTGGVEAGTGSPNRPREGGYQRYTFNGLTPASQYVTHYFYSAAQNFRGEKPGSLDGLVKRTAAVFEEDRIILEAQQARVLEDTSKPFVDLRADAAGVQMRRLVKRLIAKEEAAGAPPVRDNHSIIGSTHA